MIQRSKEWKSEIVRVPLIWTQSLDGWDDLKMDSTLHNQERPL